MRCVSFLVSMLRAFTIAGDRHMKKKPNNNYIKERLNAGWLKTASPFLIQKRIAPKIKQVVNPGSKNQRRLAKKKARSDRLNRKHKKIGSGKVFKKVKKSKPKYSVYILSKEWRNRCKSFYAKYGKVCAACGETRNIHLHHMTYRHLGNELDEELAPLCRQCHHEYHELNGVQTDMIERTVAFIEDKKQLRLPNRGIWG